MATKKSARIWVNGAHCYWVTAKQFWNWVREDVLVLQREQPLEGHYRGRKEDFLVTLNGTILNVGCPEHKEAVLHSMRKKHRR
jgi:hypothetical protein